MTSKPRLLDLGNGNIVLMDEDIWERLKGKHTLYMGTNGYVYFSTWRLGPQTLHSFIMGKSSAKNMIDHINRDKRDNRRVNLRFVTPHQNQVNRGPLGKSNTSGIRGVAPFRYSKLNPWRAQIMVHRKQLHLGLFPTVEAAIAARKAAERLYYGEECP